MGTPRNRYSLAAFLCMALVLLATQLWYYPKWKMPQTEATISWDVSGYYFYLPAVFIYNDLKGIGFRDSVMGSYRMSGTAYQAHDIANGNRVMKYPMGQAVMYLPAFLAAHVLASPMGYPADGFSRPYQFAIALWSVLVALLGLWVLQKLLLQYFPDSTVAISLVAIVLATNYLTYAGINGAMTHNYLFTLYALLLWATHRFYIAPSLPKAMAIGAIIGMAALTRPTEIISVLLPLLWGLNGAGALRERMRFLIKHKILVLAAILACGVVGIWQPIYWKAVSGHWLYYSYEEQGFSWLRPHLKEGLLSFQVGWFIYTPIMLFALAGMFKPKWRSRPWAWLLPVYAIVTVYITFAWDEWLYGGSLGARAMVQHYAVLALGLAATITWIARKGRMILLAGMAVMVLCVYYNIWLTHGALRGGYIPVSWVNRPYLSTIIGQWNPDKRTMQLLDGADYYPGVSDNAEILFETRFQDELTGCEQLREGMQGLCLPDREDWDTVVAIPQDTKWLRLTGTYRIGQKEWETWMMTQAIMHGYHNGAIVRTAMFRIQRFMEPSSMNTIPMDMRVPRQGIDSVRISFWNAGSSVPILIHGIELTAFY